MKRLRRRMNHWLSEACVVISVVTSLSAAETTRTHRLSMASARSLRYRSWLRRHILDNRAGIAVVAAALLTGGAADLVAQTGTIRGRVLHADEPIGLASVELTLSPSGATTRTDPSGHFLFQGVTPGQVELSTRKPGFVATVVALDVRAAAATELEIRLEPIVAVLDPIVASATRLDPRRMADVARTVSVTDSTAIQRGRMVGLHETLRTVPGVQAASRYGTDDVTIGIRGSAARSPQAVRGVVVLLDGTPVTEPDGVARLDLIELAAARQVEVIRGPASALYAGSPGGVVNVVSRSGRDSPGITGRAHGGAFGFRKYDSRVGGVFAGGRGSAIASASHTSTDGHRAHSEADILRGHVSLDYLAGTGTRVTFQAVGSSLESRLPGSLSEPELEADPAAAAPPATAFGFGRDDRRFRAGGRLEQALGRGVVDAYAFFGGRTLFFPIPSQIVDLVFHRVQLGGRLRPGRIGHLPLDATVGLEYDRVAGTDQRWENHAGAPGALRDDGRDDAEGLGTYVQVEWQAWGSLTATFGLRYDRVTFRFESAFAGAIPRQETTFEQASPSLAAVWRPDALTSVYASIGRGFEVPAFGELSPSPGAPIRAVYPKSLWSYEIGARRTADDRLLLEGALFLAAVRGDFVPVTIDGLTFPENASRSRNIGVELGVRALATPWLDLAAGYAFLDLRLTDYTSSVLDAEGEARMVDFSGKRMPAVPKHRTTGEVLVRPLTGLRLGTQVEWQGVVYVESGNADRGIRYFQTQPGGEVQQVPFRAVPARTLVHVNGDLRLGPATLFARIENVFGRKYTAVVRANESRGRFYEPGPPAWASFGLSLYGDPAGATRTRPQP
jgi:iron complex outermembrane recepter protein